MLEAALRDRRRHRLRDEARLRLPDGPVRAARRRRAGRRRWPSSASSTSSSASPASRPRRCSSTWSPPGYLGRKTGRGFRDYGLTGARAAPPWPTQEPRAAATTADAVRAGGGPEAVEEHPDGDWVVRPRHRVGATKAYRCPGCDQEIRPGDAARGGLAGRRARRPGRPAALAHGLLAAPRPRGDPRRSRHERCATEDGHRSRRDPGRARCCPRGASRSTLHTADGLRLVGELALPGRPRPGRHPGLPAPAAHPRRDDGQPRAPQGGLAAAGAGRHRRAPVQHPRHDERARAPARARSTRRGRAATTSRPRSSTPSSHGLPRAVAARLVVRHRPRAAVRAATRRRGGDPALAAAAATRPTRTSTAGPPSGRPLTALVPELDDYLRPAEARERFARVPAGRGRRRRRGQAPVGRRAVRRVACSTRSWPGCGAGRDAAADDVGGSRTRPIRPRPASRGLRVTIDLAGKTAHRDRGVARNRPGDRARLRRGGRRRRPRGTRRGAARGGRHRRPGRGPSRLVLPCDVTDEEAVQAVVASAIEGLGRRGHRGEQRRGQQLLGSRSWACG